MPSMEVLVSCTVIPVILAFSIMSSKLSFRDRSPTLIYILIYMCALMLNFIHPSDAFAQ